jgi:hypothetical protein
MKQLTTSTADRGTSHSIALGSEFADAERKGILQHPHTHNHCTPSPHKLIYNDKL